MTDLDFALKMYGQYTLEFAMNRNSETAYDNMCFWQNQVWACATEQAAKEQQS